MLTTSLHAFPNRNCYSVVGSSIGKLPAAPDVYEWLRSRDLAKGRRKERKIPIVVVLSPFLFPRGWIYGLSLLCVPSFLLCV